MKLPLVVFCLALAAPLAHAQAPKADAKKPDAKVMVKKLEPLSLGLTGYSGAEAARADSEALQRYLSTKLNREVTTRIFPDHDALATALATGVVDLGWMQPFSLVAAQKKGSVTPLVKAVRHGLPFYRGVLFTKADRKVEGGVKGLAGTKVAWVNAGSAAGYLFPRAAILQAGLQPKTLFKKEEFAGDHAAVCRAVLDGKADVGATFADDRPAGQPMLVDGCVQSVGAEAAKGLRIVATSAPIPNDAIAARPGLDPEELARVKQSFLALDRDPQGKLLLQVVFKAESFAEVGAEDFEPVRYAAESATK